MIFPFRIPVPRIFVSFLRDCLVYLYVLPVKSKPPRRVYVHADYITVPLFSVLLLLATRSMDGSTIRRGVLGADGVEPLSILALFLSLVGSLLHARPRATILKTCTTYRRISQYL